MATDTRETRLRRAAKRRGLMLVKSRRRDPGAIGYGRFCLKDRWDAARVVGVERGVGFTLIGAPANRGGAERFGAWLTLDAVERLLAQGIDERERAIRANERMALISCRP